MMEIFEPPVRPLPYSDAMMRVRHAMDRPSHLERLLPALPVAASNGLPGLRPTRGSPIGPSFTAIEASARDAPDVALPPSLLPEHQSVSVLMAAARAPLQAPPPPSGLESALGSRANSEQASVRGETRMGRSDIDRWEQLEHDSAGGPPPSVPQLSGRGVDRSAVGVSSSAAAPSGNVNAAGVANLAAAVSARAEAAAAAARADSYEMPAADSYASPMPPYPMPFTSPIGPLATAAMEARKLPPSPAWLEDQHCKVERLAAGASMDESSGVSGSMNAGQWRSGRSPADPGSLLSAVSTAVPERSRPCTPRQDKESSSPDKSRMELDMADATASMYDDAGDRGLKSRNCDRPFHKYRSLSQPPVTTQVPMRPYAPSYSPLSLPLVPGWQQMTASVTPMALTMTPTPVVGHAVALCNQCTTSWFPPPLPPVPCELTARIEALEQEMHAPQPSQDLVTVATESRDIKIEPAKVEQTRLEDMVASLRKQLSVSEDAAARCAMLEAQLSQCRLEWKQQVEKLEANAEAGRMSAAQEAELRARMEAQQKHRSINFEADQLRQDLQASATALEKEQHAREELERIHSEVVAGNQRLEVDFRKLQADHQEVHLQKRELIVKHEAAEADASNLKTDLQRLQEAHDAELHSTRSDFQAKLQVVEELSQKLQADLRRMETDRDQESRARAEVQQKLDAVSADADRLRGDVLRVQAARDAEQRSREDVELKHRLAEAANEQLRKDMQQLQASHDAHQRGREDAESRHNALELEMERVRHDLQQQLQLSRDLQDRSREDFERRHGATESEITQLRTTLYQAQEENSRNTRDLAAAEFRTKELLAERDSERSLVESHSSTIEEQRTLLQKARQTENDLWGAEEKVRTYEARLSGMQTEIEDLRSRLITAEASRDQLSFENGNLQRSKDQLQEVPMELEAVKQKLQAAEAEREQLQNDIVHLTRAKDQREESELSLRKGLDEERRTVQELQRRLGDKESEYMDALQAQTTTGSGLEARLAEVQQRLVAVEAERDRLQSDITHVTRAKEQREESEKSLRKGLQEEQSTVRELHNRLDVKEQECQEIWARLEMKDREYIESQTRVETLSREYVEFQSRVEIKERELQVSTAASAGVSEALFAEVEQKLKLVEAERDQLKSDTHHLMRAKDQREESEKNLRKGIEEERATLREVRSQFQALEMKLQNANADLEAKDVELKRVREERDLKADHFEHLQKAYRHREISEQSLRQAVTSEVSNRSEAVRVAVDAVESFDSPRVPRETHISMDLHRSLVAGKQGKVEVVISDEEESEPQLSARDDRGKFLVDLTDDLNSSAEYQSPEATRQKRESAADWGPDEDSPVMEVDLTEEMDAPRERAPTWGFEQSEIWDIHEDDLGRKYYANSLTGETNWEAKSSHTSSRPASVQLIPSDSY